MMPFFGHAVAMVFKLLDRAYQNALHLSYRSVASKYHGLI